MGNMNCIEKSSQLLVSVPFWSWFLIIELLTDFLENWFKKKVESLIQFIRRRNRLHVWFLSLTERLSHHSYLYTESCNRVCNFQNIFRISFLAVQDSSIGDLVTHSLTHSLIKSLLIFKDFWEQSRAEQSRAEQSRAEQSRAEQSRAEQSRAE